MKESFFLILGTVLISMWILTQEKLKTGIHISQATNQVSCECVCAISKYKNFNSLTWADIGLNFQGGRASTGFLQKKEMLGKGIFDNMVECARFKAVLEDIAKKSAKNSVQSKENLQPSSCSCNGTLIGVEDLFKLPVPKEK